MNGHRQSVNNRNTDLPIGAHFNGPSHSMDDLTILVVAGGLPEIHTRRRTEVKHILAYQTHKSGLNRDIGFAIHYPEISRLPAP